VTSRGIKVCFASAVVLAALTFLGRDPLWGEKATEKQNHVVRIEGMAFSPKTLRIAAGDSVTWVNNDIMMHAVKSSEPGNEWQSRDLQPHESWTRVVEKGGPYVCPYHPMMTAEIVTR
jgi:plastocyanin